MLVVAIIAAAGLTVSSLEANSPATVFNDSDCFLNITYVTDQNTVFGPQGVPPGGQYDIKVPTGEYIAKIAVNNVSNNPNIAVGTCAPLEWGPALCASFPGASRFCRRAAQYWVIR